MEIRARSASVSGLPTVRAVNSAGRAHNLIGNLE